MQVADFDQRRTQITERAKSIIMQPAATWSAIAAEPGSQASLLQNYAAPLAAIPAICGWIGMSVIGISVPFVGTIRTGFIRGCVGAIVGWVLALVGVWVGAFVVQKLAPTFQSKDDTLQATKIVVYASTPMWVAGVLRLLPVLSPLLIIAALYAIYLFYLGLPPVMSTPRDKVIPYMVVSALVIIVVSIVIGMISAALVGVSTYGTY